MGPGAGDFALPRPGGAEGSGRGRLLESLAFTKMPFGFTHGSGVLGWWLGLVTGGFEGPVHFLRANGKLSSPLTTSKTGEADIDSRPETWTGPCNDDPSAEDLGQVPDPASGLTMTM